MTFNTLLNDKLGYFMKTVVSVLLTFLLLMQASHALAQQDTRVFQCGDEENKVLEATRNGKLDLLKAHTQARCVLPRADKRNFTLYDIAALNGDQAMMQWLVERRYVREGQYSTAMIKLVQTGLRFLNFDAGVIDGRLNEATKLGIGDFQKAHDFRVTGEISVDWLPDFQTRVAKKMQVILGALGFAAGGADGIIGPNTTSAMQAFRLERNMPVANYAYIDDQLIYQLMMAENDARKLEIARREADRAARLVAQQAAQREAEARQREQAQRRAAEKRRQAEAAAKREREQAALAAQRQSAAQAQRVAPQRQTPSQEERLIAQQQAAAERKRKAEEAHLQQRVEAARKAELAAQAEAKAKAETEAAQRAAAEAKARAQEAFKAARSGQSVTLSPDVQVGKPIASSGQTRQTSRAASGGGGKFNQLSGRLKFVRSGGKLSQCLLNNQSIDIAWCEPYYPSGENKKCEAIVSQTGIVVSLLCQ